MTGRAALLFDLDGTLVDSDAEHLAAFQRAFARHGIELGASEYATKIMGASNAMIAKAFLSHLTPMQQAATIDAKEEDYRNSLDDVEPIAGASRFWTSLTGTGSNAPSSPMRRAPTPRRFSRRSGSASVCLSSSSAPNCRGPSPIRCLI